MNNDHDDDEITMRVCIMCKEEPHQRPRLDDAAAHLALLHNLNLYGVHERNERQIETWPFGGGPSPLANQEGVAKVHTAVMQGEGGSPTAPQPPKVNKHG